MTPDQADSVLPHLERCPCCGRGLVYIDGTTDSGALLNHTREVIVAAHGDNPLYRECRSCGARWHRHAPRSRLRAAAEAHVDQWPASGRRHTEDAWAPTPFRVFERAQAFDVVPAATGERSAATGYDSAVYVVTAWNPDGQPSTLTRNLELHRRMHADVQARGWDVREVATYDEDLRWAEQSLLMVGVDHAAASVLALEYAQPAFIQWTQTGVTMLAAGTGIAMTAPVPMSIIADTSPACPMRTIRGQPQAEFVCRNPGGPWVSASIHESARWRHQREMLLSTIGCTVCHAAPADGPGGKATYISARAVASRYGPARDERG